MALDKETQIKVLQTEIANLNNIQAAVSGLGVVSGWIYANRTGGKLGRYVGYGFLGGFLFGAVSRLALIKKINQKQLELSVLQTK